VPLDEDLFQLEYVTGGLQLPAWGTSPSETFVQISVLNVGHSPAVTRAFGLRGISFGPTPAEQAFDTDADIDPQFPFTGDIAPGEEWVYTWTLLGDGAKKTQYDRYWFRILATSPNLVPGIEIVAQDSVAKPGVPWLKTFSVVARYNTGDFSVFHRRTRIVPVSPLAPTDFE
jgi:hypothetical protein